MTEHDRGEGYTWLRERGRDLRGDLAQIQKEVPPPGKSEDWISGFYVARVDLTDLLLPDGDDLEEFLERHIPTAADAQAVEAFAEGRGPISVLRAGLFGES